MSGSVYPGAIDLFANPTSSNKQSDAGVLHATQHSEANDAINAIETTLGTNPQGLFTTVTQRISATASKPAVGKNNLTGWFHVDGYGAVGDGVTDDTAAFEAWLADLNAASDLANGLGGEGARGYIPAGNFYIPNGLTTKIAVDGIEIHGSTTGDSVITTNSGTLFYWGTGTGVGFVKQGGAQDIKIICTTPDATQCCFEADFAGELTFRNIKVGKVGQILRAGETSARYVNGVRFSGIRGTAYNLANRPVFDLRYGSGFYLSDVDVVGDGVTYPTDNTSMSSAAVGRAWISVITGSWDTISEVNVITNRFYDALDIEPPAGASVVNIKLTNVWHDYNARSAIRVIGQGGNCTKLDAVNCYFVATDGHGVQVNASSGLVEQFHFTDCTSIFSGMSNWRFEGTSTNYVSLIDCYGIGANRLYGSNTGDSQDSLVVLGSGWKVIGGNYGEDGSPYNGITNQGRYGLTASATSDRYRLIGATLDGASAQQQNLQSHTTGGRGRYVAGLSTSAGGAINGMTTAAFTIAATGVGMTHSLGMRATFYVSGGTVTQISVNGVATGMTSGAIILAPGDTWAITYSTAPTVIRQLMS